MSNVLEFRATVHAAWKIIKAETQRNLVAEMYLLMVAGIKKKLAAVIATGAESRGHSCVVGGSQAAITVSVCCLPTRDRGCGE
jgi:hypothetical protein